MKRYLLFLGVLLWHSGLQAQTWTTYNTGLVNTITIDAQNRRWTGGYNGIKVYDGTTSVTYNTSNSGLIHNTVLSSAIDAQGHMWFGTFTGASTFDGNTWKSYNTASGLAGTRVRSIVPENTGQIWFGTNGGVSVLTDTTWTTLNASNSGLVDNVILCIYRDAQGHRWFGTSRGVSHFDGTTWTTYTMNNSGLIHNQVYAIIQDNEGRMWFGTGNGICMYNGAYWNSLPIPGIVQSIIKDTGNTLWFGTSTQGVLAYDGLNNNFHNLSNSGILSNNVQSMAWDKSCGLWFGHPEGLSQLSICLSMEEPQVPQVHLFPNPVTNGLTVTYSQMSNALAELQLYSVTGQLVYRVQNLSSGTQIDLSNLSKGMYVTKLKIGSYESHSRIIKQ